jgi:hypothetical protein
MRCQFRSGVDQLPAITLSLLGVLMLSSSALAQTTLNLQNQAFMVFGPPQLCLVASTGSAATGSYPLAVQQCLPTTGIQQWTFVNGAFQNQEGCLDIQGSGTASGTLVGQNTCNNQPNQQWIYNNGLVQSQSAPGMCLAVSNPASCPWSVNGVPQCQGIPVGTGTAIFPCVSGAWNNTWTPWQKLIPGPTQAPQFPTLPLFIPPPTLDGLANKLETRSLKAKRNPSTKHLFLQDRIPEPEHTFSMKRATIAHSSLHRARRLKSNGPAGPGTIYMNTLVFFLKHVYNFVSIMFTHMCLCVSLFLISFQVF